MLKQRILDDLLNSINKITGEEFKDSIFNGYHHIYFREGELVCSGTMRECYDFMLAFRFGIRFVELYQN